MKSTKSTSKYDQSHDVVHIQHVKAACPLREVVTKMTLPHGSGVVLNQMNL